MTVDTLPGWSTQGIGNTRFVRFTYILRVYPKDTWGNTQIQPKPLQEKAPYGIREIELIGPEPSIAATNAFRISILFQRSMLCMNFM